MKLVPPYSVWVEVAAGAHTVDHSTSWHCHSEDNGSLYEAMQSGAEARRVGYYGVRYEVRCTAITKYGELEVRIEVPRND